MMNIGGIGCQGIDDPQGRLHGDSFSISATGTIPVSPVVDQSFVGAVNAGSNINECCRYIAQTFTAGLTGKLIGVNIDVHSPWNSPLPLRISIRPTINGRPAAAILGEVVLDAAEAALDFYIEFPEPISIIDEQRYAIVVDYVGAPPTGGGQAQGIWRGATGNPYPRGDMFASRADGVTWGYKSEEVDQRFQTHVVPGQFASALWIQRVKTDGARDWEHFEIAGEHFLAVANRRELAGFGVNSRIYKWDGFKFAEIQTIATNGATDWEHFEIAGEHYLAVANYSSNITSRETPSRIYRWNGAEFVEIQAIMTNGAADWEHFEIAGQHYLAVANSWGPVYRRVHSRIYRWNGAEFVEIQAIMTDGATDWEHFEIAGQHYLAVANYHSGYTPVVASHIYRWNGSTFGDRQSIVTFGATDWEHFEIDGRHYLIVANSDDGTSRNVYSRIYRWTGRVFRFEQAILTNGAQEWEHFETNNGHYLAVANSRDGGGYNVDSIIYRWNGSAFVEVQPVETKGAHDWEYFEMNGKPYLAIANFWDGAAFHLDSPVYRLQP
ncbi:MAG: hypothetical protein MJE77_05310 [Proteobacteria bacterium]|nr:hypothetical protein [Pseudomonadota bacterium]